MSDEEDITDAMAVKRWKVRNVIKDLESERDRLKAELEQDKQAFAIGAKAADMILAERDHYCALAEKMREALQTIVGENFDDGRYDCGICGNYMMPPGHKPNCVIADIQKVLALYDAKGDVK